MNNLISQHQIISIIESYGYKKVERTKDKSIYVKNDIYISIVDSIIDIVQIDNKFKEYMIAERYCIKTAEQITFLLTGSIRLLDYKES